MTLFAPRRSRPPSLPGGLCVCRPRDGDSRTRGIDREQFKRRGLQSFTLTLGITHRGGNNPSVVTSKKISIKESRKR